MRVPVYAKRRAEKWPSSPGPCRTSHCRSSGELCTCEHMVSRCLLQVDICYTHEQVPQVRMGRPYSRLASRLEFWSSPLCQLLVFGPWPSSALTGRLLCAHFRVCNMHSWVSSGEHQAESITHRMGNLLPVEGPSSLIAAWSVFPQLILNPRTRAIPDLQSGVFWQNKTKAVSHVGSRWPGATCLFLFFCLPTVLRSLALFLIS